MSYNNESVKAALKIIQQRREKNNYILEKRKEEIYEKLPEYKKLKKDTIDILGNYVSSIGTEKSCVDKDELKKRVSNIEEKKKLLLKAHGYPEDYLSLKFDCEICKDTGYVLNKKCKCLEKVLCDLSASCSNIREIFSDVDFEHFDLSLFSDEKTGNISPKSNMKKILKYVRSFISEFDDKDTKSLLFTGNTGVGKTFLSGCIGNKLLDMGKTVLYVSASKLAEAYENYRFRKELSVDTENLINSVRNVDLLIIDDLGVEFKTDYTTSSIYDVINERLISKKKTIISTNHSIMGIKDIYSERLFSRMLGEFVILEFIGNDLRTDKILNC